MPAATPTVVLSDTFRAAGEFVTSEGHIAELANRSSASLETGLSMVPLVLPEHDSDLPVDEDDDMDILLNLEGDDDPQRSSDSSNKRCLEEGEKHSSL